MENMKNLQPAIMGDRDPLADAVHKNNASDDSSTVDLSKLEGQQELNGSPY